MSSVTYTAFGGGTVQNLYIYSGERALVASEARDKDTNRSIDDNDRQQVKMLMLTLKLRCCHWQTVCGSRLNVDRRSWGRSALWGHTGEQNFGHIPRASFKQEHTYAGVF